MKQLITLLAITFLLISCNTKPTTIVAAEFIDSLITNYTDTAVNKTLEAEIEFWRGRITPSNAGYVNELKYAAALVQRFHLKGDIQDMFTADSILHKADQTFNHKQPGPNLALVRNAILQHRFNIADSLLSQAKLADIRKYESVTSTFDVAFELGYFKLAADELVKIAGPGDYGYHFRLAKMAHYQGDIDTAIAAMHQASVIADGNTYLKQAALSNEADLNLHKGNLKRANDLYIESIRLNATDLHSIMGLGWITLVHERNFSLAERIFQFVQSKTKAPDVLYKLALLEEARGNKQNQKKYSLQFATLASAPEYGNMYNKYLIQLYTGVLDNTTKAETIARRELLNRNTAQTNAWYVWALYRNNKKAEAETVYRQKVSGKPLEGLELYWMGKFMLGLNKNYNAREFFTAAYKNKFDLAPSMITDLQQFIKN